MPAPIDPALRATIEQAIRDGNLSRNAIARQYGVSPATVTNVARAAGIDTAFDRTNTEKGTRARAFDAKAARAQAIIDLYGDFQRFRHRAWSAYTAVFVGPEGPTRVTLDLPGLRDQQSAYVAAAICLDKAALLERHDDDSAAVGKSLLGELARGLQVAYDTMGATDAT